MPTACDALAAQTRFLASLAYGLNAVDSTNLQEYAAITNVGALTIITMGAIFMFGRVWSFYWLAHVMPFVSVFVGGAASHAVFDGILAPISASLGIAHGLRCAMGIALVLSSASLLGFVTNRSISVWFFSAGAAVCGYGACLVWPALLGSRMSGTPARGIFAGVAASLGGMNFSGLGRERVESLMGWLGCLLVAQGALQLVVVNLLSAHQAASFGLVTCSSYYVCVLAVGVGVAREVLTAGKSAKDPNELDMGQIQKMLAAGGGGMGAGGGGSGVGGASARQARPTSSDPHRKAAAAEAEMNAGETEGGSGERKWKWEQTSKGGESEVMVRFPLGAAPVTKKEVQVVFKPKTLKVSVGDKVLLDGRTYGSTYPEDCTWCLVPVADGHELQVLLALVENSKWHDLLAK